MFSRKNAVFSVLLLAAMAVAVGATVAKPKFSSARGNDPDLTEVSRSAFGAPAPGGLSAEAVTRARLEDEITNRMAACAGLEGCDQRKLFLLESGQAFDKGLGQGHSQRARLLEVAAWGYDRRRVLEEQVRSRSLTTETMRGALREHLGELVSRYGILLTEAEYEKLFDGKKGINPAEDPRVIPDDVLELDRRR